MCPICHSDLQSKRPWAGHRAQLSSETLPLLQEAERALFVLTSLANCMGAWQLSLPGQPAAMRRAAAAFLEFAASPVRNLNEQLYCPPVSRDECAAALMPSPLALDDGTLQIANICLFTMFTMLQHSSLLVV